MEVQVSAVDSYYRSLPFVKTRLNVWNDIESMEVFQAIPQKPHFQMLLNKPPEFREGKAIAYMITFANIAKKATESWLDDPRGTIVRCLGILVKLEKNGFDVKAIRDRLSFVLRKKNQSDLLNQQKEHNNRIMEDSCEREKIVEESGGLDKQLKEIPDKCGLVSKGECGKRNEVSGIESKPARQDLNNNLSYFKRAKTSP